MKRLFTFGCSYTKYIWPTWADFLSLNYDYYENWGLPGIGCRGIAERIAECHSRNNLGPTDTVIVQWTTHMRNDFYHTKPSTKRIPGWQTAGSVFAPFNYGILYDDDWINKFFCEPAYVMHCLNNMVLTQGLLKSVGSNWYFTSISDWPKLSSDLETDENMFERLSNKVQDIWEIYPLFDFYKKIWDNHEDHWIEGIENFLKDKPDTRWVFKERLKPKRADPHPNPYANCLWLNERVRPKLGLPNFPEKEESWIKELNDIQNAKPDRDYLEHKFRFRIDLDHWPPGVDAKHIGF